MTKGSNNESPTKYYGIYIVEDNGHYWITDSMGGEQYVGTECPAEFQIDDYRNAYIFKHWSKQRQNDKR
jgi:hypothetical protein